MGGSGGDSGFSGGGASGGGHGSGFGTKARCDQLTFETSVASPDASVLGRLSVGDVCDLVILSDPRRIAVVTRPHQEVLGAIVNCWEELLGCIDQDFSFEAEIRSNTSPARVLVRPSRRVW